MPETAREVMATRFHTVTPEDSLAEAVRRLKQASEELGERVFGLMVTDAAGRLVGMISMYDLLLLLRPKHVHIFGEMADLDLTGLLETACRRTRGLRVGDVMTTDLITIAPETHILLIVDIMLKKHVRRIPVLEGGRLVGIVYLSRVFEHLQDRLLA